MFEKVNYTYYSDILGRSVVPDADTFNSFKLVNIQQMKDWIPYIEEKETDGIDSAVCMMIEADYIDSSLLNGNAENSVASESINGHSYSYGSTAQNKLVELNAVSTAEKKLKAAKMFLFFNTGVR